MGLLDSDYCSPATIADGVTVDFPSHPSLCQSRDSYYFNVAIVVPAEPDFAAIAIAVDFIRLVATGSTATDFEATDSKWHSAVGRLLQD